MSIYLIDYENVNEAGLEGIKSLKSDDQVHIFYSDQIKTMPFSRGIELTQSKAQISFIETHKVGKNYLDFQLSTYLGFLIGKGILGTVFVISKDTGFDSVVDFWSGRNILITRQDNICGTTKPTSTKNTSAKKATKKYTKVTTVASEKPDISTSDLSEAYRKRVRAAVKEDKLAPSNYTAIYKAIAGCKDKLELNNSLVKIFDSSKGGVVYGHVKDIFADYKKNE